MNSNRYILNQGEQRHLGCPCMEKGIMTFMKDTNKGQLWFCRKCHAIVQTILFPSYEDYKLQDKERAKRLRRYGRIT